MPREMDRVNDHYTPMVYWFSCEVLILNKPIKLKLRFPVWDNDNIIIIRRTKFKK